MFAYQVDSLIPSTHIKWLRTAYKALFWRSDVLFRLPWAQGMEVEQIQVYMHAHMCVCMTPYF